MSEAIRGIMIPFIGTSLGAALVFFMKKEIPGLLQRALTGFAAGVMVAASVWSLLIPAIQESPFLLRTPIVRNGNQVTSGYQPEIWEKWI